MTVVAQLQSDGIRRLGGLKTGFRYRYADGTRAPRRQIERIQLLRIPPAWTAVAIDDSGSAWIQAVGKDKAGRWQYSISTTGAPSSGANGGSTNA